jgi:hypothetical protein
MPSQIEALSLTTRSEWTTTHLDEQIAQLQDQILDRWGATEAELGPLFYKLRVAMKKQGSRKGLGFSAWLAKNGIPRTTANRWADNYAVRIGAKKPPAPPEPTDDLDFVPSGAKSDAVEEGTPIGVKEKPLELLLVGLSDAQKSQFLEAMDKFAPEAFALLIFEAVTTHPIALAPQARKTLTYLDDESEVDPPTIIEKLEQGATAEVTA